MYSIFKTISSDFSEGVRTLVLHEEIVGNNSISTELIGVTSHDDECRIDFMLEPTSEEKSQVDSIVSAHSGVETLEEAKIRVIKVLDDDIRKYVELDENYPPHRQRSLLDLLIEAKIDGLTNRANYVQQFKDWIFNEVMMYYYTKEAEIEACTSIQSVESVTWDPTQFYATNPHVTIAHSLSITD
jgi:hypothetical protein